MRTLKIMWTISIVIILFCLCYSYVNSNHDIDEALNCAVESVVVPIWFAPLLLIGIGLFSYCCWYWCAIRESIE